MKFLISIFVILFAMLTYAQNGQHKTLKKVKDVVSNPDSTTRESSNPVELDNVELIHIYNQDQADRGATLIDWVAVSKNDQLRQTRVYELLDSNKIKTSKDYRHAAMIFQHGQDSTAYGMAVKMMQKSVDLDSTASKWLLAAAIDRYLLSKNEPQIYGTQYKKLGKDQPWFICKMDTTIVTDAERALYNVRSLKQQQERVNRMNKKKVSSLLSNGKTIDEIIEFIANENLRNSEYDLSEAGLNRFGYQLLHKGQKESALKIFELNTQLYPNASNAYDSYGECLMALKKIEESLAAYRKSYELNPNNINAKEIIDRNE